MLVDPDKSVSVSCLCVYMSLSLFLHMTCEYCCKHCIILLTLSRNVDVMCTVCILAGKLVIQTVYHKIAQPCPEQGELVHACTVQLPCCSDVVCRWEYICSHIVGTKAVCMSSSTEYLYVYVPHLLYIFSKELFRIPRDNHALNVILQSPLLSNPSNNNVVRCDNLQEGQECSKNPLNPNLNPPSASPP